MMAVITIIIEVLITLTEKKLAASSFVRFSVFVDCYWTFANFSKVMSSTFGWKSAITAMTSFKKYSAMNLDLMSIVGIFLDFKQSVGMFYST